MTRWVFGILFCASIAMPTIATAQAIDPATADTSAAFVALPAPQDTGNQPQAGEPSQPKPPAAVGEEGNKPTRGFASALVHNLGDDLKHMPRWNSVYWLAGGGALALAVHPEDNEINRHLVTSGSAHNVFVAGKWIGSTEVILGGAGAAYIFGRATGRTRVQHLGMDEIEAAILAEGFVEGLKIAVRRPRPPSFDGVASTSNTYSFPSGHAMTTFAAATVLQQHLGYKAAIPTYLIATYVATSRLHDNVHYASDVVFGAAMGIMIGRSVTWHGRNFYASPMLVPGGGGIMLASIGY